MTKWSVFWVNSQSYEIILQNYVIFNSSQSTISMRLDRYFDSERIQLVLSFLKELEKKTKWSFFFILILSNNNEKAELTWNDFGNSSTKSFIWMQFILGEFNFINFNTRTIKQIYTLHKWSFLILNDSGTVVLPWIVIRQDSMRIKRKWN